MEQDDWVMKLDAYSLNIPVLPVGTLFTSVDQPYFRVAIATVEMTNGYQHAVILMDINKSNIGRKCKLPTRDNLLVITESELTLKLKEK